MNRILWISVALAIGFYICEPIVDPDLWWHITVGQWILDRGYVPTTEQWNAYAVGTPWVAYSWSNEIFYGFVDKLYGIRGLAVLKMSLGVLLSISLFWTLSKVAKDWFFGALLGIFAVTACHNHFTLRPQSFVWVLFAYLLYLLCTAKRESWTGGRLIVLFVIFSLWANTQITTAIGIMTLILWNFEGMKSVKKTVLPLVVAFLGTLATPYFGREWIIFLGKTSHPIQHSSISEFAAASILQFATGFLVMSLAVLFLFLHAKPSLIKIGRAALLMILGIAGFAVVKFLPMAVILICFTLADFWAQSGSDKSSLGKLAEGFEHLKSKIMWLPKEGLAFFFIAVAVVNIWDVWQAPLDESRIPKSEVDFIEENNLQHPILNDFGRGGYLMYRFSDKQGNPEHLVVIDGRTNVVPEEVMTKFMSAFRGTTKWKEYLDLVQPETILWRNDSSLIAILENGTEWCRVFITGDDVSSGYSVFTKRSFAESSPELSCL